MLNLQKIRNNNKSNKRLEVKKIIVIYEPSGQFIGDTCIIIGYFRFLKKFYENSEIDIVTNGVDYFATLIAENPFINGIFYTSWDNISFEDYDVIITEIKDEQVLLDFLNIPSNYKKAFEKLCIYSYKSKRRMIGFKREFPENAIFDFLIDEPEIQEFSNNNNNLIKQCAAHELYLSDNELLKARRWFDDKGVKENEKIVILLDDTTDKKKMLNTISYLNFVERIATLNNIKILIYDHKGIGKKAFYQEAFDKDIHSRMIFAEKINLRESICLLSDNRVSLVWGPCTGLLHCASGIYNIFLQQKAISPDDIPIIIAYTGKIDNDEIIAYYEYDWWFNTFVHCLKIVTDNNRGLKVEKLSEKDKDFDYFAQNLLSCSDYTGDDLFNFILDNYYPKLINSRLIDIEEYPNTNLPDKNAINTHPE